MALVERSPLASLDATTGMIAPQITGLIAGENIDAAAPCFIHSDGKAYMCDADAGGGAHVLAGFSPRAARAGEPVTLFGVGSRFHYSDGDLTPGQMLYIANTKGRLDDAPTLDFAGVAQAINTSDVRVTQNITVMTEPWS